MSEVSSSALGAAAPLSLARYGEALALLAEYPESDRAMVLTRLKLSEVDIAACAAFWGREIQDELIKGNARSAIELARAYGLAERHARNEHPPVARLKTRVHDVQPAPARVVPSHLAPLPGRPAVEEPESSHAVEAAVPTYLRAEVQPGVEAAADPDATQVPVTPAAPTLPFRGSLSQEALAELLSRPLPPKGPDTPGSGGVEETALLPQLTLVAAGSGTFRDKLGAVAVPPLTVEEYAELRARLTVFGAAHAETLERFGVAAAEVREALRAAFNERFQKDADLQQRFLSAMHAATAKARLEREPK
jgi:hypothetical protein